MQTYVINKDIIFYKVITGITISRGSDSINREGTQYEVIAGMRNCRHKFGDNIK